MVKSGNQTLFNCNWRVTRVCIKKTYLKNSWLNDPFKNIGQNKTPKGTCTVIKNGRQSSGHSTKCAYHGAHGLGTLCYLLNITYDTFDKDCFCQFNKSNY